MHKIVGRIAAFLYIAAILVVTVVFTIRDANRNLVREVTIEAGSEIKIEDFFKECPKDARFVTDISGIDTDIPAVYQLTVFYDEAFEKDVILRIEDHTPPKGSPCLRCSMRESSGLRLPSAWDIFMICPE